MRLAVVIAGVALLVGCLTGGRLTRLARLPLRYGWVAVAALALRVFVISPLFQRSPWASLSPYLLVSGFVVLLAVGLINWRLAGFPVLIVGLSCNVLVLLANGGLMPVELKAAQKAGYTDLAQTLESGRSVGYYTAATNQTLLPYLGDLITSPPLPTQRFVYSIGDIIVAAGLFPVLVGALRNTKVDGYPG